jgi:Ca2+-binding EF-hand superfamily protein
MNIMSGFSSLPGPFDSFVKDKPANSASGMPFTLPVTSQPEPPTNVAISTAGINASTAAGSADNAVHALTQLGVSSYANGVNLDGSPASVLFQLADVNGNGQVTESELEQRVVSGGGTKQDADALYQALASQGQSGTPLTEANFQGGLAATSLDGGSFKGYMEGLFDQNGDGNVSGKELQYILGILAASGTQPSDAAEAALSTPTGVDVVAKL